MPTTSDPVRPRIQIIVALGVLSTFGPLSLDVYLPMLPQLAAELQASTSGAQLTITACLIGLALGQVIAGPLSDRYGRRRPLIIGLVAFALASLACAIAPSIGVLLILRLIQGLSGASGLVLARAIARDLYEGRTLVVFFSRLIVISGLAPILAPVLGGQLSRIMSWRGVFAVLAGLGLALLINSLIALRETLPPDRRTEAGIARVLQSFAVLLHDRLFVGAMLSAGMAAASLFAYVAGSPFVLQRVYGLSPTQFSLVFGVNAIGIMTAGQIGARLSRRWSAFRVLGLGLTVNLCGAVAVLVALGWRLDLPVLATGLFILVSAFGLIFPMATSIAMSNYPERAGAASSLFGVSQFTLGAVAAPIVGLAGERSVLPLGMVIVGSSVLATLIFLTVVVPQIVANRAGGGDSFGAR